MQADTPGGRYLYQGLAELFRENIRRGVWELKSNLPSEQRLCRLYGVSRVTVRRALGELTREGLITSLPGRGRFVSEKQGRRIDRRLSVSSIEYDHQQYIRPRVLEVEHFSSACDQLARSMRGLEPLCRVKVLRCLNQTPYSLADIRLPQKYARQVLSAFESAGGHVYIFPLLEELTGRGVRLIEETLQAVRADEDEARLLGLLPGAPLLSINRMLEDEDGRPVLAAHTLQRTDVNRIKARRGLDRSLATQPHPLAREEITGI